MTKAVLSCCIPCSPKAQTMNTKYNGGWNIIREYFVLKSTRYFLKQSILTKNFKTDTFP